MENKARLDRIFHILRALVEGPIKRIFHYSCEKISCQGPYLLLSNHNTDLDPAFIGFAAQKQIYFVATDNILRNPLLSFFLVRLFDPIIHRKGTLGISTVKEILLKLKHGSNVCIFAEGNRSFNGVTGEILPSTAKVAKRSGASLVTYRIDGGYFAQPRWGKGFRKGKISGKVVRIYSPDELKGMSESEISACINADLYVNAYEVQAVDKVVFRGKRPALGMESAIFACPVCSKIGTLHSDSKSIFCSCGFSVKYTEFGFLSSPGGELHTVLEYDLKQQSVLKGLLGEDSADSLFEDDVILRRYLTRKDHEPDLPCKLKAFRDHLELADMRINFGDIEGLAIFSRNTLSIYLKNSDFFLEIHGDIGFNALKYKYLYNFSITENR